MLSLSPANLSHQLVNPPAPTSRQPLPTAKPSHLAHINAEQRGGRKGVWKPPRAVGAKGAKWLKWLENPICSGERLTLSQVGQRNQGAITTKWPGKQSAVNQEKSQPIEHVVFAAIRVIKKRKRPTLLPYVAAVCLYLKREMAARTYWGESLPGKIWTGSWDKDLECTLHGLAGEWWRSFSRPHHLPVTHISEPAGFADIYCWFPQPLREHLQLCLLKLPNQQMKD